jgi:4-amino-4-deoxy-L-arabinose transferase-like glycosyltransferase
MLRLGFNYLLAVASVPVMVVCLALAKIGRLGDSVARRLDDWRTRHPRETDETASFLIVVAFLSAALLLSTISGDNWRRDFVTLAATLALLASSLFILRRAGRQNYAPRTLASKTYLRDGLWFTATLEEFAGTGQGVVRITKSVSFAEPIEWECQRVTAALGISVSELEQLVGRTLAPRDSI